MDFFGQLRLRPSRLSTWTWLIVFYHSDEIPGTLVPSNIPNDGKSVNVSIAIMLHPRTVTLEAGDVVAPASATTTVTGVAVQLSE